jgi:hypothetical protein
MYTYTSHTDQTITISKLEAKYPSDTVSGVLLDASKVYFSTGGKGNYTFTILKNGAKPSDVNPIDGMDSIEPGTGSAVKDTDDLDAETDRQRLKGPGARAAKVKAEPKTDAATLGRERRR